jgi:hypothetical protein
MRMGTEEDFGSLKGLRANEKEVRRRISIRSSREARREKGNA